MARLPLEQRLLFIGLFSNADDQGRLQAHPALIRSMVFPYDDMDLAQIEAGLRGLAGAGCIHLYEAGGGQCLQIVNWWKYQKLQWAAPSGIPAPEGWRDRVRYREGGRVRQENWGDDTVPGFSGEALGKALPEALGKGLGEGDRQSFSQGDRIEEYRDSIDQNRDRIDQHRDRVGGGDSETLPPALPPPRAPKTGKNDSVRAKSGLQRVREGPGKQVAAGGDDDAEKGQGDFVARSVPDPGKLTVRQIKRLALDDAGWEVLRGREEAGRGRVSALAYMDQQLNKAPPAVLIYHGIADCWPKRAFWDEIGRRVGDDPDTLAFWEQVVKEYLFCGWNKLNVRAMLEFFGRRELPPGNGRGRSGAAGWVDPIAAVQEAIREQGWD